MINEKKAFTLPETSITIVILAFAILYSILSFTVSKYASVLSKQRIVVLNLVRGEMENILDTNYDLLSPITETFTVYDGLKSITVTKTVNLTTEDPGTYGYKKLYVEMAWSGGVSGNRTLSEEAIMYVTRR